MKAAVLGASGGIGQPLSLLLKICHLVTELSLYDIRSTPGVSADLSHIATSSEVAGYLPENDGLKHALTGAEIVMIPAGVPRQPGMTCRDDLFRLNAGIVKSLAEGIARYSPGAFVLVITNPVNSTLPIVAEVLKKAGVFNPARVFGVTTLDVVRAQTFVKPYADVSPAHINVPVIGGHSNETIVPLFSQAQPPMEIPNECLGLLTDRVQKGGEEVVRAKGGFNSATLSMAFAGFRLAEKVMRAANGEEGLVESTFLSIADIPGGEEIASMVGTEFFSVPVEFGRGGAIFAQNLLPDVSEYEGNLLRECVTTLRKNIAKGIAFAYHDGDRSTTEEPVSVRKQVPTSVSNMQAHLGPIKEITL